ncbi:hypothetical protein EH223_19495 [candidate division KSB1 bacterium]|nr:hypothetical protein [candidate division KSB1 bacterium]RQW00131.1 MAG: hypothetical protein EH223_19495 [candidate division KSB1 bacterium]
MPKNEMLSATKRLFSQIFSRYNKSNKNSTWGIVSLCEWIFQAQYIAAAKMITPLSSRDPFAIAQKLHSVDEKKSAYHLCKNDRDKNAKNSINIPYSFKFVKSCHYRIFHLLKSMKSLYYMS